MLHHWTYGHPEFSRALGLLSNERYCDFDVRGLVRIFHFEIDDTVWPMIHLDAHFSQRFTAWFRSRDVMDAIGEKSFIGGSSWEPDFATTFQRVE